MTERPNRTADVSPIVAGPDVLLMYPPQQTFYGPHLGLPSLVAALRTAGIRAEMVDLNQRLNRTLLTREWLTRAATMADRSRPEVAAALEPLDQVLEVLPPALANLADPEIIQDMDAVLASFSVLSQAYGILGAPWWPSQLSYGFTMPSHRLESWEGATVAAMDHEANPFITFLERELPTILGQRRPRLVGIGVTYRDQLVPALTLARLLRRLLPRVPLVAGGALMSRLLPRFVERGDIFPEFDYVIVHEGETAIAALYDAIVSDRDPAGVPNLLRRTPEGLALGPRHQEDVRALPTPDFSDLDLDGYLLPEPVLPLLTSRGCYWARCGFCAHHTSYGPEGRYRPRPKALVARDLDELVTRYRAKVVYLVDEAVPLPNLRAVASHVEETGLGVAWFGDVRMEAGLTLDTLRALERGGCEMLIFGLESGSQRVLDLMDKGYRLDVAARVLHDAAEAGIFTVVMLFVGFPGETVPDAQDTLRFIQEHAGEIGAWGIGSFSLLEGSPAHGEPRRFGISWISPEPEGGDLGDSYGYRPMRGLDQASASRIANSITRTLAPLAKPEASLPRELIVMRRALARH